jgi:outer membrane protein OmpA-like peptidoglycan-associated protein
LPGQKGFGHENEGIAIVAIALLLCCSIASAATPSVTSVAYPEKQSVNLAFAKTTAAPTKATMKGSVKYEAGQARISLSYSGMEPAVLFGGDIAAYVVWAIGKSAAPENLGELLVLKKGASGKQEFMTGKKDFAIMVTAEPYYLVSRPFDLVLFTSMPKDTKKNPGTTFAFDDFRPGPKPGVTSIADMKFEDKTAVPVRQAESVLALIDRLNADEVNPAAVKNATVALGEAKSTKDSKKMTDAARRSISSSAEALRDWGHSRDELAAAQASAKTAAEKAALEANVAATQQKLSTTEAEKAAIAKERDQLGKERDMLTQDRTKLAAERDALAARLQNALGAVADTKKTARGTVTSLSGVLFDTGKSVLKPDAKITLAKLAGVMLVFSKTNMQIEGYTDNVGAEAANLKLSEARAKAVRDFFESQGIASNRLTFVGKGPADPVAPNDTADGRAKNRRVEIISSEPQL